MDRFWQTLTPDQINELSNTIRDAFTKTKYVVRIETRRKP